MANIKKADEDKTFGDYVQIVADLIDAKELYTDKKLLEDEYNTVMPLLTGIKPKVKAKIIEAAKLEVLERQNEALKQNGADNNIGSFWGRVLRNGGLEVLPSTGKYLGNYMGNLFDFTKELNSSIRVDTKIICMRVRVKEYFLGCLLITILTFPPEP